MQSFDCQEPVRRRFYDHYLPSPLNFKRNIINVHNGRQYIVPTIIMQYRATFKTIISSELSRLTNLPENILSINEVAIIYVAGSTSCQTDISESQNDL